MNNTFLSSSNWLSWSIWEFKTLLLVKSGIISSYTDWWLCVYPQSLARLFSPWGHFLHVWVSSPLRRDSSVPPRQVIAVWEWEINVNTFLVKYLKTLCHWINCHRAYSTVTRKQSGTGHEATAALDRDGYNHGASSHNLNHSSLHSYVIFFLLLPLLVIVISKGRRLCFNPCSSV